MYFARVYPSALYFLVSGTVRHTSKVAAPISPSAANELGKPKCLIKSRRERC